MEKRSRARLAKRRATMKAEGDAVPRVPSNLVSLLNKLKSISDYYKRTGDDGKENEIRSLLLRMNSKQSQVNDVAFTFRHFSLAGNARYATLVNQLIALCTKAEEEVSYPIGMMLDAQKERLRLRAIECVAEGLLPEEDEIYLRLKDRIKSLQYEAGR